MTVRPEGRGEAGARPSAVESSSRRRVAVEHVIRRAKIASVAFGIILSPIPLADELVLLPGYGLLTVTIAKKHGLALAGVPWRPIALTSLAGLGARAAVNLTVSYIPFVAAAANAASAAALTGFIGRYIDAACEDASAGLEARSLGWREIAVALRPRAASAGST